MFSAVIARIDNIDYFRAVGWYNLAFGVLSLVLLFFTFHGEFSCKKVESPVKTLHKLVLTRTQWRKVFSVSPFLVSYILVKL